MKRSALVLAITAAAAGGTHAGTVTTDGPDIVINTKGGFEAATTDGQFAFEIGGRLQWDYDNYSDGYGDGSDSELRRGRVYVAGTILKDWGYKFQYEFDEAGNSDLEDAYIKYAGLPAYIKGGRFKRPFGLEELTSSKHISTIERASFYDMLPVSRSDMNLEIGQETGNYTWALGIYENDGLKDEIDDTGDVTYSYGGRVTFAPINEAGNVVHLGAAAIRVDYGDNLQDARLRTRFGVHTGERIELVDGLDTIEDEDLYGLEAAWVAGPFSLQGEYVNLQKNATSGAEDVELDAYYLMATYNLMGQSRVYSKGEFKSPKGGVELVAKYEGGEAELMDTTEYTQYTLGVNWYVNKNVRLSANYLNFDLDDTDGFGFAPIVAGVDGEDGSAFTVRAQLVF
jgi:phosphate-selective porin OprO/OprP